MGAIERVLLDGLGQVDEADVSAVMKAKAPSRVNADDWAGLGQQMARQWLMAQCADLCERELLRAIGKVLVELSPYDPQGVEVVRAMLPTRALTRPGDETFGEVREAIESARATGTRAAHQWVLEQTTERIEEEAPRLRLRVGRQGRRLVAALGPVIRRTVAAKIGRDNAEIDDFVQDIWCIVLGTSGLIKWRPDGRRLTGFVKWLATRTIANEYRRRATAKAGGGANPGPVAALVGIAAATPAPLEIASLAAFAQRLDEWIRRQPPDDQTIYHLLLQGEAVADIAARCGCSEAVVYRRRIKLLEFWVELAAEVLPGKSPPSAPHAAP